MTDSTTTDPTDDRILEAILRYDPDGDYSFEDIEAKLAEFDATGELPNPHQIATHATSDRAEFEQAAQFMRAALAILQGDDVYAGTDLTVCPDCGREAAVRNVVFPGGDAHE